MLEQTNLYRVKTADPALGFEPRIKVPETLVMPLHYAGACHITIKIIDQNHPVVKLKVSVS